MRGTELTPLLEKDNKTMFSRKAKSKTKGQQNLLTFAFCYYFGHFVNICLELVVFRLISKEMFKKVFDEHACSTTGIFKKKFVNYLVGVLIPYTWPDKALFRPNSSLN